MKPEWFSYSSIRYKPEQILFLLEHKDLLESGKWPTKHIESGYTGSPKGRRTKTEGNFVKAIVIIAELNIRLKACGDDGKLLVERYTYGYDEIDLARIHRLEYEEVIENIGTALSYCQGAKRKRTCYKQYKAGRRSYKKNGKR